MAPGGSRVAGVCSWDPLLHVRQSKKPKNRQLGGWVGGVQVIKPQGSPLVTLFL